MRDIIFSPKAVLKPPNWLAAEQTSTRPLIWGEWSNYRSRVWGQTWGFKWLPWHGLTGALSLHTHNIFDKSVPDRNTKVDRWIIAVAESILPLNDLQRSRIDHIRLTSLPEYLPELAEALHVARNGIAYLWEATPKLCLRRLVVWIQVLASQLVQ